MTSWNKILSEILLRNIPNSLISTFTCGVPRLRLLRVRNDSCIVPNDFKEAITVSCRKYNSSVIFYIMKRSEYKVSFSYYFTHKRGLRRHPPSQHWTRSNKKVKVYNTQHNIHVYAFIHISHKQK